MMRLLLLVLLLLLRLLPLLVLMLFKEFDDILFFVITSEPNRLLSLLELFETEPESITLTKLDGNTPVLPFSLPFHQPELLVVNR